MVGGFELSHLSRIPTMKFHGPIGHPNGNTTSTDIPEHVFQAVVVPLGSIFSRSTEVSVRKEIVKQKSKC
jgi:hypothetical protein